MDEQNQQPTKAFDRADEQAMLAAILENTRKTNQYVKWQLIITVAMVVLPLLAMVFIIPMLLSQLSGAYGASGLLQ